MFKIIFRVWLSIFFVFILLKCEFKREALGADNEIRIICSEIDKDIIKTYMSKIFTDTIFTPEPEPYYYLKFSTPEKYNKLKFQSQVSIVALERDSGNPGYKLMKKILPEEQFDFTENFDPIILSKNVYAKNQLFMVINAKNGAQLDSVIKKRKNQIRKHFHQQFNDRQSRYLFGSDRNKSLEDSLRLKFGWSLKIPWGWEVIKSLPESNFVWLGKEMPFQWIGISWEEGNIFEDNISTGEYIWSWPEKNYGYIQFNNYKFELKESLYNGYKAWRVRGVWETIDAIEAKGGPFNSYIFYDEKNNLSYHLNYLIHHPGNDKSIFMRQLDLIVKSFKIQKI